MRWLPRLRAWGCRRVTGPLGKAGLRGPEPPAGSEFWRNLGALAFVGAVCSD